MWLWLRQEQLIFYPQPLADSSATLAEHVMTVVAGDGTMLSGWVLPQQAAAPLVIYFGGNAEEISPQLAQLPQLLGASAAGFNYRGYGASGGSPGETQLRADALVVFDAALAKLGQPARQTIVIGRSLGSHLAAYVAAHRPVGGLILVTPFDSIQQLAADRYRLFPVRHLLRHPFDTAALTAQITAPTHAYLAEHDDVVPAISSHRLLNGWQGTAPLTHSTIAASYHYDILEHSALWDHARGLTKTWNQPSGPL